MLAMLAAETGKPDRIGVTLRHDGIASLRSSTCAANTHMDQGDRIIRAERQAEAGPAQPAAYAAGRLRGRSLSLRFGLGSAALPFVIPRRGM
jgi:hypothetical protein